MAVHALSAAVAAHTAPVEVLVAVVFVVAVAVAAHTGGLAGEQLQFQVKGFNTQLLTCGRDYCWNGDCFIEQATVMAQSLVNFDQINYLRNLAIT